MLRLLTLQVSGGAAQADVVCPGQERKTLAPDIFAGIDVGIRFMATAQTPEYGLADPVAGIYVSAL